MKEPNQKCAPSRPVKPNWNNKDFAKWSKAESCKREDNIVSTEWHETLKTTKPFYPVYDNKPVNMIYLMSGEYGRLWRKERDEWYSKVFVPKPREKDMLNRAKKIRKEIREQKKAAEISIQERKERRAKEIEAKAKAEAEKLEKIRAKVRKFKATKLPQKQKKTKEEKPKSISEEPKEKENVSPEETKAVENSAQCECSSHDKEAQQNADKKETTDAEPKKETTDVEPKKETTDVEPKKETTDVEPKKEENTADKNENESEKSKNQNSDKSCLMCEGYFQQLKDIQKEKSKMTEPEAKPSEENEKKEENPE